MLQTMDSRKRPLSPDGASSSSINSKKRAVNSGSATNSPRQRPNGDLAHDEPKDENLENFRKEAVYRRMKHYARELERTQAVADELEKRKNTCEAGMAAMEACWNQLLDTLRSLVRSEKLPPADDRIRELFDLVRRARDEEDEPEDEEEEEDDDDDSSDYQLALQDLAASSQSLIAQVAQLAPHSPPDTKDLRNKLHLSQTEANSLRSQVHLLRGRLADTQAESESLRNSLQTAENKLERAKSRTLQPTGSKPPQPNGSTTPSPDVKEETPVEAGPSTVVTNGEVSTKSESEWKSLAESRQQLIDEMNASHLSALMELKQLKAAFAAPTEEMVVGSVSYKLLQEQLNNFRADVDEYKTRWNAVRDELDHLKENQRAMHEEALSKSQATIEELQSNLQKREADCLRLRETRDALTAEASVRRARDSERANGVAQLKVLVDTRGDRIAVLMSEIRRLKAAIAAQTGSQDLLQYVMGLDIGSEQGSQVQPSYVADLQARLESAQARLQAMEHPGEAEIELAKFHKAFGKWQDVFAEGRENIVAAKEAELNVANLKCAELEAVLNDMYTEVDKLSVAWETLDKQNKLKVFELIALEDKLLKVTTEKAKADNKYFQVMKAKETQEAECKTMSRNMTRQTVLIDKYKESQTQMGFQLASADKESVTQKRMIQLLSDRVEEAVREMRGWNIRYETERARVAELEKQRNQADAAAVEARAAAGKAKEEVKKAQDEAKQASIVSGGAKGTSSARELELQKENSKVMALLRCSTCVKNFRSHTLLKCMHTFCKDCIDARVTTRQRKCPACNMAFAAQDVQQIYFQ
ncbi:E3 ubiquitin-protein ligase BRE1 [Rhizoctonia solani]|uniref:E3 ubiquitin protein ligase n=1 Tax=Rhizoctonia solani TaxID=456999 RepID=A0A0K6FL55_9AGAM|nr:E3 ubiquitin-protein ligase BRE1 [Rhizoctonia solani]